MRLLASLVPIMAACAGPPEPSVAIQAELQPAPVPVKTRTAPETPASPLGRVVWGLAEVTIKSGVLSAITDHR